MPEHVRLGTILRIIVSGTALLLISVAVRQDLFSVHPISYADQRAAEERGNDGRAPIDLTALDAFVRRLNEGDLLRKHCEPYWEEMVLDENPTLSALANLEEREAKSATLGSDRAVVLPHFNYKPVRLSVMNGSLHCHPLSNCKPRNYDRLGAVSAEKVLRRISEALGQARREGGSLSDVNFTIHLEDCPKLWRGEAPVSVAKGAGSCQKGGEHGGFYQSVQRGQAPPGMLLSESTHLLYSWDIPGVPYGTHNNRFEEVIRNKMHDIAYANGSLSEDLWAKAWNSKEDGVFFIGRFNDDARLQLACQMSVLDLQMSRAFYISDAAKADRPRQNCTKHAIELERAFGCSASHICRGPDTSFDVWQEELFKHKYVLDLPGIGPWSARLSLLLLSGAVVFQHIRNFEAAQFYDAPLKRRGVLVPFSDARDLQEKLDWFRNHDDVAQRVARAAHQWAWTCLTRESIGKSLVTLLRRLGTFQKAGENRTAAEVEGCRIDQSIALADHQAEGFDDLVQKCLEW
ncbi:unnamed protein product [Vitrella brassicaformis CCMP3155]|uniref:Glycosyl transferase CAP10 domain-containing protein n=1 Tax=Vitrella brassicaformis (strain CCMP3155) TaxID=1169540 RepID=A0A0G4G4J8_VITBC|nr:unnamed protein product [Vitrella brassicaformis CCMP3155]|eukprot:CEM23325.1 unnamed protein product [Vitrella brassicaformis CCMP3155]